MNALHELKNLWEKEVFNKSPLPEYARPDFQSRYRTKKNSNKTTAQILDFLHWSGFQAERINTMGIPTQRQGVKVGMYGYKPGKTIYRPSGATKGSADISAIVHGLSVKIEVKSGNDRQSEYQRDYQQQVERAGGVYILAYSFDEFLQQFKNLLTC